MLRRSRTAVVIFAVIGVTFMAILGMGAAAPAAQGERGGKVLPPHVETGQARVEEEPVVYLEGTIYPRGHMALVWFQWGRTTSYGHVTEPEDDEGSGVFGPESGLDGIIEHARRHYEESEFLRPGTTYHFRIVAKNQAGTARGADGTFRTPKHFVPPGTFDR